MNSAIFLQITLITHFMSKGGTDYFTSFNVCFCSARNSLFKF